MPLTREDTSLSDLTRSFLLSALDHVSNDTKTPLTTVKVRLEAWKSKRSDIYRERQEEQEKYVREYEAPRADYQQAYDAWVRARNQILQEMKSTHVIGMQESLMTQLLQIPFPEILKSPVAEVYTRCT